MNQPRHTYKTELINARTRKGWTQAQLASRAGLSVVSIGRAEAGKPISVASLEKIVTALGGRLELNTTIDFP